MLRTLLFSILVLLGTGVMADELSRTVSVSGSGQIHALPDRATVNLSIVSRARELDAAQSGAAKVTAAVLALTDKLKIERNKVDTTGASVRPDYRWNRQTEEQELRGYIAERQMNVNVEDLEKLGRLVEGAVAAGVNQVSPPQLDSSKRDDLHREALALAVKNARANAEVLVQTLGARLGDPISISDNSAPPRPPIPQARMAMAAMESDSAATYNPGDLTFNATVAVVFELVD